MIEGQSSRDFARAKTMLYTQPELMHQLLEKLALSVIDYLNAQIRAGAQAVQIFDTWGGALSHSAYAEFSLAYMKKIVRWLDYSPRWSRSAGHIVYQRRWPLVGGDG